MSADESEDNWQVFAADNAPPSGIDVVQSKVSEFIIHNTELNRPVVLITSGGTTVPMEQNTVRFVDNFSNGTRGSASAEYFLKHGYAVVFMHRRKSMEPFVRHLEGNSLLKSFIIVEQCGTQSLEVSEEMSSKLIPVIKQYQDALSSRRLLHIPFTTVSEYLHFLHIVSCCLRNLGGRALLYLAAAVSDFYIPSSQMAMHKISSNEPLDLHLQLVPKLLHPLVRHWTPEAFVVSFKLETDESLLMDKARQALEKYGHRIVIANLLNSIRTRVILVTKDSSSTVLVTTDEQKIGIEIEEKIVKELANLHLASLS